MAKKKTDRVWRILIVSIGLSILLMLVLWIYEWAVSQRTKYVRFQEFGIEIPAGYTVHGIDVSRYQHLINWELVKAMRVEDISISFAFIKATEGNISKDRQFRRNWRKAKEAGMTRGAYHFFLATKSGRTQAENFIQTVALKRGDMPPVIDIEQTYGVSPAKLRERVREWLVMVENYYGVKPIIYTNVDFYKQYLNEEFDDYPLWVAHYINKGKPRIIRDWQFWQYSETGKVNGIVSKVDFNVFNGDSLSFAQLLMK